MKAIIDRPPPNENAPTTKKKDPTLRRLGVCALVLEFVIAGIVIDQDAKCAIHIQATTTAMIANPALREWNTNTPPPPSNPQHCHKPKPPQASKPATAHAINRWNNVLTADCPSRMAATEKTPITTGPRP